MVYSLVVDGVQTKVTIDEGKLTLAPDDKPESRCFYIKMHLWIIIKYIVQEVRYPDLISQD